MIAITAPININKCLSSKRIFSTPIFKAENTYPAQNKIVIAINKMAPFFEPNIINPMLQIERTARETIIPAIKISNAGYNAIVL